MGTRVGIMQATRIAPKLLEKFPNHCFAQPKLNGMRGVVSLVKESVVLRSSEETLITSLPALTEQLRHLHSLLGDIKLDGEFYIHGAFLQTILHYVKRGTPLPDNYRVGYHIFDVFSHEKQNTRIAKLMEVGEAIYRNNIPYLDVLQTAYILTNEWESYCTQYVTDGFEGIILRHPEAPYEFKRSKYLLKHKPLKKATCPVVSFLEAVTGEGIPKRMLGAVRCHLNGVYFNVGAFSLGHERCRLLWQQYQQRQITPSLFTADIVYPQLTISGTPSQPIMKELHGQQIGPVTIITKGSDDEKK